MGRSSWRSGSMSLSRARPPVWKAAEKPGYAAHHLIRRFSVRNVPAFRYQQCLDRSGASIGNFAELCRRAVLIGFSLYQQSRTGDGREFVQHVPCFRGRIEPGIRPGAKYIIRGIAVIAAELFSQGTLPVFPRGFLNALQGCIFHKNVRRFGNDRRRYTGMPGSELQAYCSTVAVSEQNRSFYSVNNQQLPQDFNFLLEEIETSLAPRGPGTSMATSFVYQARTIQMRAQPGGKILPLCDAAQSVVEKHHRALAITRFEPFRSQHATHYPHRPEAPIHVFVIASDSDRCTKRISGLLHPCKSYFRDSAPADASTASAGRSERL